MVCGRQPQWRCSWAMPRGMGSVPPTQASLQAMANSDKSEYFVQTSCPFQIEQL